MIDEKVSAFIQDYLDFEKSEAKFKKNITIFVGKLRTHNGVNCDKATLQDHLRVVCLSFAHIFQG